MKVAWEGAWETDIDGIDRAKAVVMETQDGFVPGVVFDCADSKGPVNRFEFACKYLLDAKNEAMDLMDRWFWLGVI